MRSLKEKIEYFREHSGNTHEAAVSALYHLGYEDGYKEALDEAKKPVVAPQTEVTVATETHTEQAWPRKKRWQQNQKVKV